MLTFIKVLAIVIVCFFVLTFIVYIFNLDMKLMAAIEKPMSKIYDKRKRNRKI